MAKKNYDAQVKKYKAMLARNNERIAEITAQNTEVANLLRSAEGDSFRDFLDEMNLSHDEAREIIRKHLENRIAEDTSAFTRTEEEPVAEVDVQATEKNTTEKKGEKL